MAYPSEGVKYAHTQNSAPTRTYSPPNSPNRIAGVRYGNTIRSERTSSGILRTPPAIAFDFDVLNQATADGCDTAQVFITDTHTLYTVSIADFRRCGKIQTRVGKQVVLSLKYWTVNGQAPKPEQEAQPEVAQLGLFGGAA